MATLNQIASILAERAGKQNDNPFIEQMKVLVSVWRSRLLRDSLENNRKDRMYFKQYFEVPLIDVNVSELPGFPEIIIKRTKCQLPDPVRANGIIFDYVGSPDKLSQFTTFSEQHRVRPALNGRYTGDTAKGLWLSKYIYIFNAEDLDWLGISGVFDDPRLVNTESCGCSEDTCFDDDKEYPISGDIQQRIIQAILGTELRIPTQGSTDNVQVDAPEKA